MTDGISWLEQKRLFGILIDSYMTNPAKYYEYKREMLQEDKKLFGKIFRGVEKEIFKP